MRLRAEYGVEGASALEKVLENKEEKDAVPETINRDLEELLDFYDCRNLLPYADHIMWLASVKEVMGYIPFHLDYFTIKCLTILQEEVNKKSVKDSKDMQDRARGGSDGRGVGMDKVIIER